MGVNGGGGDKFNGSRKISPKPERHEASWRYSTRIMKKLFEFKISFAGVKTLITAEGETNAGLRPIAIGLRSPRSTSEQAATRQRQLTFAGCRMASGE